MKNRKKKPLIMTMCVVFALITVLAGTFAWFTSQDEVKNRLQTSKLTDGDVTIVEAFDPDDKLEPGVAVNKQAGAINTGDADALVRMSFEEALTKLKDGTQVYNAAKYANETGYIPELVNIDAYEDWTVLTGTALGQTDTNAFDALPAGITVVYQKTAADANTNADKYRFAAYATLALGTTPETYQYQRVEISQEAFSVVDGKLKITLDNGLTGTDKVDYFNFITLQIDPLAPITYDWTNPTAGAKTFAALTEPTTPLNPNNATRSLSSEYIQLIFGTNVITTLDATAENNDGKWYYNAADGWFYYMGTLESGQSTGNLLEKVYMNQAADKSFSHTEFDLTVKMEGIQAVKDAVTSNVGWDLANTSYSGANADLIAQLQTYTK